MGMSVSVSVVRYVKFGMFVSVSVLRYVISKVDVVTDIFYIECPYLYPSSRIQIKALLWLKQLALPHEEDIVALRSRFEPGTQASHGQRSSVDEG